MKEEKTAKTIKYVWAILKKKKTYTLAGVMYSKDMPVKVNIKTAKYLRNTGLFLFEKIK